MKLNESGRGAVAALVLLVPVPTIGTAMGMMILPGTAVGQAMYGAAKVWILVLPVVWLVWVEGGKLSVSRTALRNLLPGAGLGAAIGAAIVGAYWVLGSALIDPARVREMAAAVGLDSKARYVVLAAYLTAGNSLLEEYVWRWFVYGKCERLLGGAAGVLASALFFTVHHVVALSVFFDWPTTVLCSAGVFIGGAAWSWCYLRYRSIWPGYVSHAIVDAVVFAIGWQLIFE